MFSSLSLRGTSMPRRAVVRGLALAAAIGLSACAGAPSTPQYPDIRFTGKDPLIVKALRVDVNSDYQPPFIAPNVEHLMPISPERMARQWALDRLQPLRSGDAIARFTILDARVIETKLKTATGLKGAFTDEPAERYDAYLRVRVSLDNPTTRYHGEVETSVQHSMTVQEGASMNQREAVWYELVKKLGASFDASMDANLHQYMPAALGIE